MSLTATAYTIGAIRPYKSSGSAEPAELFPDSVKRAFERIEAISSNARQGDVSPSAESIAWAKKVLLRVLPRHYLLGAEIDAFQREIHVNWEHGTKSVTVFLPSPDTIKIYWEEITDHGVQHGLKPQTNNPWEVSGVLGWLFE